MSSTAKTREKLPEEMDSRLAEAARQQAAQPRKKLADQTGANTPPGEHSEVHATDRALKNDPETEPKDVTVYNHNPRDGTEKPCCPNCTGTLNAEEGRGGVNTTTPPRARDEWWVDKEKK